MEREEKKIVELHDDGVDRRGFLKCMAWAGTGLVWTMSGGIPVSRAFAKSVGKQNKSTDLTFVQISDSHMGFNKPANTDVIGTLKTAIDQINGLSHNRNSCCIRAISAISPNRKSSTTSTRF